MTLFLPLDRGWRFRSFLSDGSGASDWETIDLPHNPFITGLDGQDHWFGECEYQRDVALPIDLSPGRSAVYVSAAMHTAIVSIDGREIARHVGGYLPFEVDLTQPLSDRQSHTLTLRLNNRDDPDVPPGKPYAELDFCWYSGLYGNAELRFYPEIYIPDPMAEKAVAGGGVFVRTVEASKASATLTVKTQVRNAGKNAQRVHLTVELLDNECVVARAKLNEPYLVPECGSISVDTLLVVVCPRLWQPDLPALYNVRVSVISTNGSVLDARTVRFGIRRIAFSRENGFTINGRRLHLRGVNRHQEHPFVGYAVPRAAQRRDALRIKEAGFDYVRLSHYPQSPDFLDACDELGMVVMNCIPGWQYIGGERFREACFQNARDLIRRDRNHPCVVLWELSLNETAMDDAFMAQLHAIGHEEYPGDQMFTCGWQDAYDVFVHARQHGEMHRWRNGDKALVVAEYGDWEFYASNRGFDQKSGAGVFAKWSHGRQLRAAGERGLRQQVLNHAIALNDTLSSAAVLNGLWSMFDYARGYDAHRAACGIADVFRLPKFSYYFFRSQREPNEGGEDWSGGPSVFIASYWTPASDLRVLVFSNCEEVELRQNGVLIGRHKSTKTWMTQYLPHPPFVFELAEFTNGTLEAVGLIDGKRAGAHRVSTPNLPARLKLEIETAGIFAKRNESDLLIAHALIVDAQGTLCVGDVAQVSFTIEGDAKIVGPNIASAEAGIASVIVRLMPMSTAFILHAQRKGDRDNFTATCAWAHPASIEALSNKTVTIVS